MPCEIITIEPGNAGPEATLEVVTEVPNALALRILPELGLSAEQETAIRRGILLGAEDDLWVEGSKALLMGVATGDIRGMAAKVLSRALFG
jgi:hypothetical protein